MENKNQKKLKLCDTKILQAIALYSCFKKKNKLSFCSTIKTHEVILVERGRRMGNKCKTQIFENLITDVQGNRCAEEK
ncbi:hypothetical protein RN001_014324 [Aquatica leii]|uniref:Uncharacterized protein n=1 Tax=Aquatica leii TaxID=1421715 RepID=A0AAN7SEH7_9COLE|nr:hypothetical protein RN001_014324 [Aquatica leii]